MQVNKAAGEFKLNNDNNSRTLVLSGDVTDKITGDLLQRIGDINEEDTSLRQTLREEKYKEKPIKLFINTDGGSAHAATAIMGAIEMSETPVYTFVLGKAFSAGLWIALAGDVRFAHRLSTYMYHELSDLNVGKLESQKRQLEENEKFMIMMDDYLLEKSNIDKEKLEKRSLNDWYFSAEEALDMGVADYIITPEQEDFETDNESEF